MLFTRVRLLEEQKKTPKLLHGPEQWLAHSVIMLSSPEPHSSLGTQRSMVSPQPLSATKTVVLPSVERTLIAFVCVCPSSLVESRIVSGTSLDGSSFHYHSDAQGNGNGSEIDVVDEEVICGSVNSPLPHPVFACLQYTVCKNKRGKVWKI